MLVLCFVLAKWTVPAEKDEGGEEKKKKEERCPLVREVQKREDE